MGLSIQAASTLADLQRAAVDLQAAFGAAARYLGISPNDLRTQLAGGKSLADVAQARGKTVDGLRTVVLDAVGAKPGSKLATRIERLIHAHPGHRRHDAPASPNVLPTDRGSSAGDAILPRLSVQA